ncbi:MAG: phosphatidylglycerophosphatase A [Candidatus Omnitrophica bacterium]|nr:phosphatidylglycerophosphatase A [Candidatus Omnitrophota bacterium]
MDAKKFSDRLIKTIVSFFYLGHIPFIPGTFGSLGGIIVYYLVKGNLSAYLWAIGILLFLSLLLGGKAEQIYRKKDANYIVIDEVLGMLLALLFLPYDIKLVVIAFVLFRALDALKPYPCGWVQNLKGSLGVVGDDIVAGIYTNIIIQIALRLASFRAS